MWHSEAQWHRINVASFCVCQLRNFHSWKSQSPQLVIIFIILLVFFFSLAVFLSSHLLLHIIIGTAAAAATVVIIICPILAHETKYKTYICRFFALYERIHLSDDIRRSFVCHS